LYFYRKELIDAATRSDYKEIWDMQDLFLSSLRRAEERRQFDSIESLSIIFFGMKRYELLDDTYVWQIYNRYVENLDTDLQAYFAARHSERSSERARQAIAAYRQLQILEGLLEEKHRISRSVIEGRHGITRRLFSELEEEARKARR
jgi:hypothetical protein